MSPPPLFFLFTLVLALLGPLPFLENFRVSLLLFAKQSFLAFGEEGAEAAVQLRENRHLTGLSPLLWEHGRLSALGSPLLPPQPRPGRWLPAAHAACACPLLPVLQIVSIDVHLTSRVFSSASASLLSLSNEFLISDSIFTVL